MMMLLRSELQDYKFTNIYKAEIEENKVYIKVLAEYKYFYSEEWLTIGCYDIESKQGRILLEGYKEYKWYKSLKTMINAIYKANINACMTSYESIQNKIKAIKTPQQRYNEIVKILTSDTTNGIKQTEEELRQLFAEAKQLELSGQVIIRTV
jgi:hypothetical protein